MSVTSRLWGKRVRASAAVAAIAMPLALMAGAPAQAQVPFDVIGPQEYNLPVDFKPFNAFVQYGYVQNNSKAWNLNGDSVEGSGGQNVVGLSKYVRFWTPEFNRNIGLAFEVIQPEVSIRDRSMDNPHLSGFGDTITGFAGWYKPTPKSTLGIQSFVQIPWGDSDVSTGNWQNLTSILWYTPLVGPIDWTGDAGFNWQSATPAGLNPALLWHTNQRFGWIVNDWIEPFVGFDYEYIGAFDGIPEAWAFDGGVGVMFATYPGQSFTVRYSKGLWGENHTHTNSLNLKYAYTW